MGTLVWASERVGWDTRLTTQYGQLGHRESERSAGGPFPNLRARGIGHWLLEVSDALGAWRVAIDHDHAWSTGVEVRRDEGPYRAVGPWSVQRGAALSPPLQGATRNPALPLAVAALSQAEGRRLSIAERPLAASMLCERHPSGTQSGEWGAAK